MKAGAITISLFVASLMRAGCFASDPPAVTPPPAPKDDGKAAPKPGKQEDIALCELLWDGKIDDSLDLQPKVCRVRLDYRGGKVTGNFDGPVLGMERDARFVGQVIKTGAVSLLLLEQQEKEYTCVYQLQIVGGKCIGVWHDTRGGKGDVELREVEKQP